ncbi:serine acetyltransferase [Winogradskyella rapida]|uniref:Serine acetyltransferase n=1 Tax=Winogradskyella rapida TaxID=549701 RepID=A0ABW3KLG3_9FLAO
MKPTHFIKKIKKKILIPSLYRRYVLGNGVIQEDIIQTLKVRGSKVQNASIEQQFKHLMTYYPDYAFVFFWRINKLNSQWRKVFVSDIPCKLFRNTKIAGGMLCYHPFASVINAESIGKDFQFRNGLTIGNKGNDNQLRPIIGDNVTVGANVVIIGSIKIGNNVVIGAGSVVVKDVPSNCVIAGNPAKIIKEIDEL